MTSPRLDLKFTTKGTLGFFASLNLVAFVLVFLFLPETRLISLEDLDKVFSRPTKIHVRHQVNKVPWAIKTVLRKKPGPYLGFVRPEGQLLDHDVYVKYKLYAFRFRLAAWIMRNSEEKQSYIDFRDKRTRDVAQEDLATANSPDR